MEDHPMNQAPAFDNPPDNTGTALLEEWRLFRQESADTSARILASLLEIERMLTQLLEG